MSTARILVAIAGPAMNIVLAFIVTGVHWILLGQHVITPTSQLNGVFGYAVLINFILFFFNLIPAPPLDGGHVLEGLTPYRHRATYENYARFGPFILMAVVLIPQLAQIFIVPAFWCAQHLYGLFGLHLLGM
jgi:Zn-dependent protease